MANTLNLDASSISPARPTLMDRVRDIVTRRRMYTTTVNELGQLSDRELNEMGMGRHGIRRVAWEYAYGDRA